MVSCAFRKNDNVLILQVNFKNGKQQARSDVSLAARFRFTNGCTNWLSGTRRSRPRWPAPLVEPGAVFAHLLALRCRRVALAGRGLVALGRRAPTQLDAVVGVVRHLEVYRTVAVKCARNCRWTTSTCSSASQSLSGQSWCFRRRWRKSN